MYVAMLYIHIEVLHCMYHYIFSAIIVKHNTTYIRHANGRGLGASFQKSLKNDDLKLI